MHPESWFIKTEKFKEILKIFNGSTMPSFSIFNVNLNEEETKCLSKLLAKSVMCKNKIDGVPCLKCVDCKKIEKNIHPDVIYPEKSKNSSGVYGVDAVRKINLDSYISPNEAKFKFYVFLEAEDITIQAQNALLKLLENPPKHAIFIFFCKDLKGILSTVKSRAFMFSFNFKNNLSLGVNGSSLNNLVENLIKAINSKNEYNLLSLSGKMGKDRPTLKKIIELLVNKIDYSFKRRFDLEPFKNKEGVEFADDLLKGLSLNNLVIFLKVLNRVHFMNTKNVNLNILVTYFLSNLVFN